MKDKEIKVILLGCLAKRTKEEQANFENLIVCEKLDWGFIGGVLVHHRLSGYFYYGLGELRNHLTLEFMKTLRLIVNAQKSITSKKYNILGPILADFEKENISYACLKGLIYELEIYNVGARRSNDCDILVWENEIDKVDSILRNHGFIQSLDSGKTEASRKSKLIQRMNYHDLIPYYKEIDFDLQNTLKIDINFHVVGKDNDITKVFLDYGTRLFHYENCDIRGLRLVTHFLHLCIHFYREATNTLWINKRRDILLYKIIDVVNTFRSMSDEEINNLINKARDFNVTKQLYFTLVHINMFYPELVSATILKSFEHIDKSFMNQIVVEGEHKVVEKNFDYVERAFDLRYNGIYCKG